MVDNSFSTLFHDPRRSYGSFTRARTFPDPIQFVHNELNERLLNMGRILNGKFDDAGLRGEQDWLRIKMSKKIFFPRSPNDFRTINFLNPEKHQVPVPEC